MPQFDSPNTPILPRNGMTFAEFRQLKSGVLPDTIPYTGGVALPEKLYQVEGQWLFDFRASILARIMFLDHSQIFSQADFKKWLSSAKNVIADFTRSFGQPATHEQGTEVYYDHLSPDSKGLPLRHIYQEATWKIAHTEIQVVCHLKSNRYDHDPQDDQLSEYWNYDFQIDVLSHDDRYDNSPSIYGRFYLGMSLEIFAERYPQLFPHGTAPSGQWVKQEDWQGLQGEWNYIFMYGKLVQFQYNAYFQNAQANQAAFQTCHKAVQAIIADFTRRYGKPNESKDMGVNSFNDPIREKDTYQDVVSARWLSVDGMRIMVEFNRFHAGDGSKVYTVNVQATDKVFGGQVG